MPKGSFVILIPLDADYICFPILHAFLGLSNTTNDLFLRLNLDHSKNEYNLLKLKENHLFSYA